MTFTHAEAYREVMNLIDDAWAANPTTAAVDLQFDDRKKAKPGEDIDGKPLPYAMAAIAHIDSEKQCIGAIGSRQYEETATVTIQIFTAFNDGRAFSNELVQIATDFFRGHISPSGEIEIKDVGPQEEMGQDGPYYNVNIPATFSYFQIG